MSAGDKDHLWVTERSSPGQNDFQDDLQPPASHIDQLKDARRRQQAPGSLVDYFQAAPSRLVDQLTDPSVQLCFPLSFFSDACSPPTNTEKESLRHAFLAHFHTPGYFIRHVHAEPFTADRPNVALAVSSVGCVALYDAPRSEALWTLAYRVTLSTLNIDNSQTRSMSTVAAFLPLAALGALASNLAMCRDANSIHGVLNTMSSRVLVTPDAQPADAHRKGLENTHIILYLLLVDTVRSLHYGMTPTIFAAASRLPLGAQLGSFAQLTSQTLFGEPRTRWPVATAENGMLVLLLVLNHIMNWARAVTLGQEAARAILPTTTDADFQREGNPKRSLVIIERTLLKWSNIYLEHMPMEVKACFYFCKLHLLVPDLNGLAQFAAYAPAGTGVASRLQYIEQTRYAALGDIREASSLSWLILENVPESADMSALWLPVILHFAGLVIWIDMKAQGQLGVRAPLLRLFEQKLRAMRWPCCATMADNLLSLSVAANV